MTCVVKCIWLCWGLFHGEVRTGVQAPGCHRGSCRSGARWPAACTCKGGRMPTDDSWHDRGRHDDYGHVERAPWPPFGHGAWRRTGPSREQLLLRDGRGEPHRVAAGGRPRRSQAALVPLRRGRPAAGRRQPQLERPALQL